MFLVIKSKQCIECKVMLFVTFEMQSLALYSNISDILLIAIEKGMIVCSQVVAVSLWDPLVQRVQKTVSQVSQKSNSWLIWTEHFGITSLRCLDIKSSSWLTRKDGGKADTPPRGMVISSLQIGHRNEPLSRVWLAAIRVRQCRHTVWEHCRSFGVCSWPSYIPEMQKYFTA